MKNSIGSILISHALFLILFTGASLAFAQEPNEPTRPTTDESTPRVSETQERTANLRTTIDTRSQDRITNVTTNISTRVDAIVSRLQNIIDRLSSRIKKLEERGVDTSEASLHLASAQRFVASAKQEMANIDSAVRNAVVSDDVRANWLPVKQKFIIVKDHLKNAHSDLRKTVIALKSAIREASEATVVSETVTNDTEIAE